MKEFLNFIQWFRGLVIILIVERHCRQEYNYGYKFEEIMQSLDMSSTILFVFISGYLFQYLNGQTRFEYLVYLKKKFRNVVIPYLLISIPAIINNLMKTDLEWMPIGFENPILKVFYMLFTGKHLGTLWFMPMIFIFYLLSPLFNYCDKKSFYMYVFPFIFLGGLFTYRYGYYVDTLDTFIYFVPIYLLGMFVSNYSDKILALGYRLALPLFSIYILITGLDLTGTMESISKPSSFAESNESYFIFNLIKLKVSLLCIVCLILLHSLRKFKLKSLVILGDYSFGIYFLHMYIIIFSRHLPQRIQNLFSGDIVNLIIYLGFVISMSMLIIYLIKKIFKKSSRMMIGS